MRDVTYKHAPETRWHLRAQRDAKDYFNDPASIELCHAIEADDIDHMEQLIAEGVDVNRVGKGGMTALMWAMPDHRLKRFECLLRHGADPNVSLKSDFAAVRHPLFLDPERRKEIIRDHGCRPGDSVMILACSAPIEYLRLVLEHGGDPDLADPQTNAVPLDVAVERWALTDSDDRVALLLDHGADARLVGRESHPVFSAMSYGNYRTTVRLLCAGADPTRFGAERLERFKADLQKGLKLYAKEPSRENADRHAKRSEQLAEIVAWMKSHGQEIRREQR
jgi:ankyrin repeat protein